MSDGRDAPSTVAGDRRPDPPGGAVGRPAATLPDAAWGPLAVGSLLLAVGLIGLAAGRPWLFPSLGPTAVLQAEQPGQRSARFYNAVVGHLVGMAAGLCAVLLLGARTSPSTLDGELAPVRVWAAVLAAVLTLPTLALLGAAHPPAAATMLLFALGGFEPSVRSVATVVAGVLIVATLGEGVRHLRLAWIVPPPPPITPGHPR